MSEYELDFYRSFWVLDTERSIGMAIGPIPRSAIVSYAQYEGMTRSETDILIRVIREMDRAYIRACAAKRESEASNK